MSFELWHNGVKLSKDNSIKVEWQAVAPPDPSAVDVPTDFPMSTLPAAEVQGVWGGSDRMSSTNLLGRKPMQNSIGVGGYGTGYGGGGWENKTVVQTHVTPAPQNRS